MFPITSSAYVAQDVHITHPSSGTNPLLFSSPARKAPKNLYMRFKQQRLDCVASYVRAKPAQRCDHHGVAIFPRLPFLFDSQLLLYRDPAVHFLTYLSNILRQQFGFVQEGQLFQLLLRHPVNSDGWLTTSRWARARVCVCRARAAMARVYASMPNAGLPPKNESASGE